MNKKETVLIVDDEEMVRKLLSSILQQNGYDVISVGSGQEALARITAGEADVMLLDIKMPGLSGLDVLEKLSNEERWIDFCVVMVTAITDLETATRAMKLGAYDFITKPFDEKETIRKLGAAISKRDSLIKEKQRYRELSQKFSDEAIEIRTRFSDLMDSLFREHVLIQQLAAFQRDGGKKMQSKLPKELKDPVRSVEEFKQALIKMINRS